MAINHDARAKQSTAASQIYSLSAIANAALQITC